MVKKVEPEKARQGRSGIQVLVVLVVGLILASAAWYGAEWYGESIDGAPDAAEQATSPSSG